MNRSEQPRDKRQQDQKSPSAVLGGHLLSGFALCIVGLCFTATVIHRGMVLEIGNTIGDGKRQEKVAWCSQITLPAKLHRPSSNRQCRSQSVKLLYSAHANIPGRFQITYRNWRDSWALHNGETSQELDPELLSIEPLGSGSTHLYPPPKLRLFYHPTCYSP